MPVKRRSASQDQLELFQPKRARPVWRTLPEKVRSGVRELLGQMLTEHIIGSAAEENAEEKDDE
jgi:hypothetical protein